jgi:hypothetical protein
LVVVVMVVTAVIVSLRANSPKAALTTFSITNLNPPIHHLVHLVLGFKVGSGPGVMD